MFDVIVRGASVIDGTGAPARSGDVGIVGDRIAAVGALIVFAAMLLFLWLVVRREETASAFRKSTTPAE